MPGDIEEEEVKEMRDIPTGIPENNTPTPPIDTNSGQQPTVSGPTSEFVLITDDEIKKLKVAKLKEELKTRKE